MTDRVEVERAPKDLVQIQVSQRLAFVTVTG